MNHDSPAEIRAELERRGLTLKKRWGQNFLINRGARETIVSTLDPGERDVVWEIGPGLGAMTELLVRKCARCVLFEVDRGLCRYLEEAFGSTDSLTLVPGDFLKTWRDVLMKEQGPSLLLGNLPYRSASLMIADMILGGLRPGRLVVTVQKELAARMGSQPGSKSYSSFSVLCQSMFTVEAVGDLQPGSFYPAPDVVSSIVRLAPRKDAPEGAVLEVLEALLRGLFASRRKTLRNNVNAARLPHGLSAELVLEELARAGADPGSRAEEHPPETFMKVALALAVRAK